jgi:predicted dehydrogenase
MSKTKVAVVGVGHHGRHHARNLAALPDVELVAVVDANEETATAIAEQYGAKALSDPKDLLGKVDGVCIATPTVAHFGVAHHFLRRGIAAMIEKPLTFSLEEGRELLRLAENHRAVLQVGHIERYNPVWTAVEKANLRPEIIESRRLSKFPFRALDVSVVFDVMIHDLELTLSLIDSPITMIEATGQALLSPTADRVQVSISFANGARVHLTASRAHHETVRQMTLWDDGEYLEIDFLRRTSVHGSLVVDPEPALIRRFPANLSVDAKEELLRELTRVETVTHDREVEPIRLELEDFVHAIRTGSNPKVTGEHGYKAVQLANQIHDTLLHQHHLQTPLRKSA